MSRIELTDNGVIFKEAPHEYWLGEKQLFGITEMLQRQLFSNEYDECPETMKINAGLYGTKVHRSIQHLLQDLEHDGSVEVSDFIELTKDMKIERSEYNVTDYEHWSSNIDTVFRVSDDTFDIGDIKTYSGKLTTTQTEKARWQMSIYAHLLEHQVKGAHVRNLYILHIRNRLKKDGITIDHISEIVPIERIPGDICKQLLDCDLKGEQFRSPFEIPENIIPQVRRIRELLEEKNKIDEELAVLRQNILQSMEFLDIRNWTLDDVRITRKLPTIRSAFSLPLMKKDFPDLPYDNYIKQSTVSGGLTVTIAA